MDFGGIVISGFWLGMIGYGCLILNDLNLTSHNNDHLESLYAVGGGFLGLGILTEALNAPRPALPMSVRIVFGVLAAAFFAGLVWCAFVAGKRIVWKKADRDKQRNWWERSLADTGIYGVIRHPSVWAMLGLLLCLRMSTGFAWMNIIVYSVTGWLLAFYEDAYVFPELVNGYAQYCARTPFLFPGASGKKTGKDPGKKPGKKKK